MKNPDTFLKMMSCIIMLTILKVIDMVKERNISGNQEKTY